MTPLEIVRFIPLAPAEAHFLPSVRSAAVLGDPRIEKTGSGGYRFRTNRGKYAMQQELRSGSLLDRGLRMIEENSRY